MTAEPVTVAVDANGADLGPAEVAAGAREAAAQGVEVLLFGPAVQIGEAGPGVTVVDAPVSVAKASEPVAAVRAHPEASIVQAARAVAGGRAAALVSGGSTGAAVAAGLFHVRRSRGIHRPALAVPVPAPGGRVLLLDVGAGVQARPEHLVQFAFMGAAFSHAVLGVARPRVGLLSNGEEPGKGAPEVVEAGALIAARAKGGDFMDFLGNVEGTDVATGAADVIVTDGFTGNVALKLMEGVAGSILGAVREAAEASPRGRAGGLLLRPALRAFRDRLDPEEGGGAHVLGLRSAAVVAHGRFGRRGFARAIAVAERAVRERSVERTHEALEDAGVLRRPASAPAASVPASP